MLTCGLFVCLGLCLCPSLCFCIFACLRLCLCLCWHIFLEQRLPLNAGGRESRMNGLDSEKESLATIFYFQHNKTWAKTSLFSCPGQLNRWPCHSLSKWVSESGHFWFKMTTMTTLTTMTTITTMTTMTYNDLQWPTMTTITTTTTKTYNDCNDYNYYNN